MITVPMVITMVTTALAAARIMLVIRHYLVITKSGDRNKDNKIENDNEKQKNLTAPWLPAPFEDSPWMLMRLSKGL